MHNESKRPWSDDEDERLRRLVRLGVSRADISDALGRTICSVARRKSQLRREGRCPTS
jgi:hypothetical protein